MSRGLTRAGVGSLLMLTLTGLGCRKGEPGGDLVLRGRGVYMTSCIACHNPDPSRPGNLGPAVQGASLKLLRLRVLKAQYPPGYTPKRTTRLMTPLPHLAGEIDALHAFLNR
ncbi:MAG TPA: hypothetical protein VGJ84_09155 [Polyangiaceae bacterium]